MVMRLIGVEMKDCLSGLGVIVSLGVLVGLADGALAQTANPRVELTVTDVEVLNLPTVQEEVVDVFFSQDKNFFANQRFPRTLIPIFGIIENDIGGDARRVNRLYEELLQQQFGNDPIRVADLASPFTGSLGTTPLYVEEPLPPASVPSFVPPPRTVPGAPSPRNTEPTNESVPALW